ncbi:MAG: hypothetical protein KF729_26780 [Sandaracinaceae bacterium]|nr:hypothetical protein [Sandaracinaceae bacterium]
MDERTRWLAGALTCASILGLSACDGETMMMTGDPPLAPRLDAVPPLTNASPIELAGEGEPGARLQVRGAEPALQETTVGADGRFRLDVTLVPDAENRLLVSQRAGELDSPTVTVDVVHDGTPPGAPALDPVTSPTRRATQRLRGSAEAGALVTVSGAAEPAETTVGADGRFELTLSLTASAENALEVVARDAAGNESGPARASITHDPSLAIEAPVLDDFPAFTRDNPIALTGTAEPGVTVDAVGGAADATATVAEDGTFTLNLGLRPNQRNTLTLFASDGIVISAAASAIIEHDDIAPEPPVLDPLPSPTGAEVVRLTGTTEPAAELEVTGGAAAASATADSAGAFAVDVTLRRDAENMISVVARDRTGNEGAPATVSITQDSTLEAPIFVDPVSSPTRMARIAIGGRATAGITISVSGGADPAGVETTAAGDGTWSVMIDLTANAANELVVTRPGSGVETVVVVVHDTIPPDPPTVNPIPTPTGATAIVVSGRAEPGATVSVSGGVATVVTSAAPDGRYSAGVTIAADATSTLSVIATDRAGNASSPRTVMVAHSSSVPEPPELDAPTPPDTRMPTHLVTGTARGDGVTVRVSGGAGAPVTAPAGSGGRFEIEVTLQANTENRLEVVAVTGVIESPAAIVTITHDDIAPEAPVSELLAVVRNSGGLINPCTGIGYRVGSVRGQMGAVEPLARVWVRNVARSVMTSTMADDVGAFTIPFESCAGEAIRVWAEDAAGNVGPVTQVNP